MGSLAVSLSFHYPDDAHNVLWTCFGFSLLRRSHGVDPSLRWCTSATALLGHQLEGLGANFFV